MDWPKLIIALIILILLIVIIVVAYDIDLKYKFVKENGKMYKQMLEINSRYKFKDVNKIISYHIYCKSKRNFDNFDSRKHFYDFVLYDFSKIKQECVEFENRRLCYNAYLEEILRAKSSFLTKEQVNDLNYDYLIFHKYEEKLFNKMKYKKYDNSLVVRINWSYTSPAGRNSYSSYCDFRLGEVKQAIINIENSRYEIEHAEERKRLKEEEKKQKAKELKEKLKRAAEVDKREKELQKKEEEFVKATKGHIYSSENDTFYVYEDVNTTDSVNGISIESKLRKLRKSFDNGEITYSEYKKLRDDLLEE